jgi:hypothetical protein
VKPPDRWEADTLRQLEAAETTDDMVESTDNNGGAAAAERIIASKLSMYRSSCAVMAVEAWRMWNEFPDQRNSMVMPDPLRHFRDLHTTLDEVGLLMSHMVVSPVMDDSFILQSLFTDRPSGSCFLRSCLVSAIMVKYGESHVRSSVYANCQTARQHSHDYMCTTSSSLFRYLAAYTTRRRMNAF